MLLTGPCLSLALSGCGPQRDEPVELPEVGATVCYTESGPGPRDLFVPPQTTASGETLHCTTEVNGFPSFSHDSCFVDRLEAAGFEEAKGWAGYPCHEPGSVVAAKDRGWEEVRCWYVGYEGDSPSSSLCYGLVDGRWIFVYPPCTRDEGLDNPEFEQLSVEEFCPAVDPADVPEGAYCYDEIDPDPDEPVQYGGCLQPIGKTWIALFTPCSVDAWIEPTTEPGSCER